MEGLITSAYRATEIEGVITLTYGAAEIDGVITRHSELQMNISELQQYTD